MNTEQQIDKYYEKVIRGVELLNSGTFNSLYLLGSQGIGKSFVVDKTLDKLKANYKIFKGEVSEAKWFEFLQNNKDKIIVLRDVGRLLRRLSFIDSLKAITEPIKVRKLARLTYAKHEGVEEEIEFTGKILFELNSVPKRFSDDLHALFSRGIYIELNLSIYDIKAIMLLIAKNKEQIETTKYLFSTISKIGIGSFNLRTQNLCFKVYEASKKDKKDWKQQINLFLENEMPESRKLLYRFTGFKPVRRIEFVKFLMRQLKTSYATAQRKIADAIYLGEIFTNTLHKQALISLNPFSKKHLVSNVSHPTSKT